MEGELFVVRLWDGIDGAWIDVSDPLSQKEADEVFNKYTKNGTEMTKFDDIDYYRVFPTDTKMAYSGDNEMWR